MSTLHNAYTNISKFYAYGPEGRDEKRRLRTLFQQCKSATTIVSEFKVKLATYKAFQTTPNNTDSYLIVQPGDEVATITFEDAFEQVSRMLNWDEIKQARKRSNHTIEEIFFRCDSTFVNTTELNQLVTQDGSFGKPQTIALEMPLRGDQPGFTGHPVLVSGQPTTITWAQLQHLHYEFIQWSRVVFNAEDIVWKLQKKQYDNLDKSIRLKERTKKEEQIAALEIPFDDFFAEFQKVCPLGLKDPTKRHPFWSTTVGKNWENENNADVASKITTFLTFPAIWTALCQNCPVVINNTLALAEVQGRRNTNNNNNNEQNNENNNNNNESVITTSENGEVVAGASLAEIASIATSALTLLSAASVLAGGGASAQQQTGTQPLVDSHMTQSVKGVTNSITQVTKSTDTLVKDASGLIATLMAAYNAIMHPNKTATSGSTSSVVAGGTQPDNGLAERVLDRAGPPPAMINHLNTIRKQYIKTPTRTNNNNNV